MARKNIVALIRENLSPEEADEFLKEYEREGMSFNNSNNSMYGAIQSITWSYAKKGYGYWQGVCERFRSSSNYSNF